MPAPSVSTARRTLPFRHCVVQHIGCSLRGLASSGCTAASQVVRGQVWQAYSRGEKADTVLRPSKQHPQPHHHTTAPRSIRTEQHRDGDDSFMTGIAIRLSLRTLSFPV